VNRQKSKGGRGRKEATIRTQAAQHKPAEAELKLASTLELGRLETRAPDDPPAGPPYEELDDPDLVPEEEDDYPLPDEDDEYASPAVEPHEEPLVAP
jgi:hypothetical protein